jgi:hypothetical protein
MRHTRNFKSRRQTLGRTLLGLALLVSGPVVTPLFGQDVVIDWENRQVAKQVSTVPASGTISVQVKRLNDLLFDYKITVTEVQGSQDDLSSLLELLKPSGAARSMMEAAPLAACPAERAAAERSFSAVETALKDKAFSPQKINAAYRSTPLKETEGAWFAVGQRAAELRATVDQFATACPTEFAKFQPKYLELLSRLERVGSMVNGDHTRIVAVRATRGSQYEVAIEELVATDKGPVATKNGKQTFSFTAGTSPLNVSGGFLLSAIERRQYESRAVPGGPDDTPVNRLVVANSSPVRPAFVGLLNYDIPWKPVSGDKLGLALSFGPTIGGGGSSDVSNFGVFGGLSVHLWKRAYFTVGPHFGEFADYPAGFAGGDIVPSGIGAPIPVKRWTVKLGIGLTVKASNLGQLRSLNSTNTAGDGKKDESK